MMWWYFGHGWGWHGFAGMLLTTLLVLCLLGVLIYALIRGGNGRNADPPDVAGQALRERYARGEIDEQELERRQSVLHRTRR